MMTNKAYTSLKSRLKSSLSTRFIQNKDGIASIEFTFIAPIMIIMYFGMAEITTAISIDRKISHAANVAGDLTTQSETVSAAEMSEILAATLMVMNVPTNTAEDRSRIKVEISSYSRDDDDNVTNRGKATFNAPFPASFDASSLDTRILSDTSGVVVARIIYNYEPLKLRYTSTDITLTETFILKPRKSANVDIKNSDDTTNFTCEYKNGKPDCT